MPRLQLFPGLSFTIEDFQGIRLAVLPDEPIVRHMRTHATQSDDPVVNAIVATLSARPGPMVYLDIGTNYGLDLCRTAHRILERQGNAVIAGFDPGTVRDLVPHNLALNGLQDIVSFYPVAVADRDGVLAWYSEAGHSENNRIVNPTHTMTVTSLCPSITVDSFIAALKKPSLPVFMKIDTQGAEPLVFSGAKQTLNDHPCVIITEFTPEALLPLGGGVPFLQTLSATHELYDLGAARDRCLIVPDDSAAFSDAVHNRAEKWTDLLLLPKNAPQISDAIRKALKL